MVNGTELIRVSKELYQMIRFIEGKAILEGKKKPTQKEITIEIANMIDKEKLWQNVFNNII